MVKSFLIITNCTLRISYVLVFLLINVSCSRTNYNDGLKSKVLEKEKVSSQNTKVDTKKLAKEAAYMIGWDIIWAAACKSGLHLSLGICLAVDTIGDVGIITYSNFGPEEKTQNQKEAKVEKAKEKRSFEPLEFIMGIGIMTLTLILI